MPLERRIQRTNRLPRLLSPVVYLAVGFVERVVRHVPFGGGGVVAGCPGAGVDAVFGVVFHESHGGVGACFGVPGAGVEVGGEGGVGHFWWRGGGGDGGYVGGYVV